MYATFPSHTTPNAIWETTPTGNSGQGGPAETPPEPSPLQDTVENATNTWTVAEMTQNFPTHPKPSRGVSWMVGSVFLQSFFPLIVAHTRTDYNPLIWQLWFAAVVVAVWCVYLFWFQRPLATQLRTWLLCFRLLPTTIGVWALANTFMQTMFVWSAQHVDPTITTVIFNLGAIRFMLLLKKQDHTKRYLPVTTSDKCYLFAVFLCAGAITLSQTGTISVGGDRSRILTGVLLALAAAELSGKGSAARFRLGTALCQRVPEKQTPQTEMGCLVLSSTLSMGVGSILVSVLLTITGTPISHMAATAPADMLLIGAAGALGAVGALFWRYANLITNTLNINGYRFTKPALALTWLWLFSTVTVARPEMFWIGASGALAINFLLSGVRPHTPVGHISANMTTEPNPNTQRTQTT